MASLIYLGIQIKLARQKDRLQNLESTYLSYNDVRRSLYENEDLARIFLIGTRDPDSLTEIETFRLMAVLETLFLNGETYWSKLAGDADDRLQITLDFLSFYLTTPGGIAFWSHPQSNNLTVKFRRVLELHEVAIFVPESCLKPMTEIDIHMVLLEISSAVSETRRSPKHIAHELKLASD